MVLPKCEVLLINYVESNILLSLESQLKTFLDVFYRNSYREQIQYPEVIFHTVNGNPVARLQMVLGHGHMLITSSHRALWTVDAVRG